MESPLKNINNNIISSKALKITPKKLFETKVPTMGTEKDLQIKVAATVIPKRHKSYENMIIEAIQNLKDRNGASFGGIKKYIMSEFLIQAGNPSRYISKSLKKAKETGVITKIDNRPRYKLSAMTLDTLKKTNKPKKVSKTRKGKENIAPTSTGKKSDKDKKLKTKKPKTNSTINDKKPKVAKKKTNDKLEPEMKKKMAKNKLKRQISTDKETEDDNDMIEEEAEEEEEEEEPIIKKSKKDVKIISKKNDKNQEKQKEKQNKKEKTVKIKPRKSQVMQSATIIASNKLKKQARKSLIKINLKKKKQQMIKAKYESEDEVEE